MLWIWLDFLPQFADKGHDIAVVKGVFLCPYLCVYLLFGEYPALIGCQKHKQIKFLAG